MLDSCINSVDLRWNSYVQWVTVVVIALLVTVIPAEKVLLSFC